MKIRFLGTAAGGGLPQWNCACAQCGHARQYGHHRTQDCLAISGDGQAWYLVNASLDLRVQLLRTPELAPGPGIRQTPVRGVLLTSAELDHTLGLLSLREAQDLAVYGTATVLEAIPWLPILSHYTKLDQRVVTCGEPFTIDGGLSVAAYALGGKLPRYITSDSSAGDWVTGLRFTGRAGESLAYLPGLATWTESVTACISGCDVVVLDGTFYTEDETAICGPATGHLPIQDSLPYLRSNPGPRYFYTHLNNTNPVSGNGGPHRTELAVAGAEAAQEAGLIEL